MNTNLALITKLIEENSRLLDTIEMLTQNQRELLDELAQYKTLELVGNEFS